MIFWTFVIWIQYLYFGISVLFVSYSSNSWNNFGWFGPFCPIVWPQALGVDSILYLCTFFWYLIYSILIWLVLGISAACFGCHSFLIIENPLSGAPCLLYFWFGPVSLILPELFMSFFIFWFGFELHQDSFVFCVV